MPLVEPYELDADTTLHELLDDEGNAVKCPKGSMIVNAVYRNLVPRSATSRLPGGAQRWFTSALREKFNPTRKPSGTRLSDIAEIHSPRAQSPESDLRLRPSQIAIQYTLRLPYYGAPQRSEV